VNHAWGADIAGRNPCSLQPVGIRFRFVAQRVAFGGDGSAAVWLVNGTSFLSAAVVGNNLGPAWDVIGAADFNGNGKTDILWQHDNAVWLMNGTLFQSSVLIGVNPGADWELAWA
jgi:hypothetical protein